MCKALLMLPASFALIHVPGDDRRPSIRRQPVLDASGDEMKLTLRELPEMNFSSWDEPILAVNWADTNGDNLPDLFVGSLGGTKAILQNTGTGNFSRFDLPHCGQYMDPPTTSHVHFTDCQRIAVHGTGGSLVENTGVSNCPGIFNASPFMSAASVPCIAEPFAAQGAVWADFNNDGSQDYYQAVDGSGPAQLDSATRNAFFVNRGGHLFGGRRGGLVTGTDAFKARSRMVTVGDFDGDGRLDILLVNEAQQPLSGLASLIHEWRHLFNVAPGEGGSSAASVLLMQKEPEENVTTYTPTFEDRSQDLKLEAGKWQEACDGANVKPEITSVTTVNTRAHSGGITRLLVQTRCALHLLKFEQVRFQHGATQKLEHSLPCPVLVGDFDNIAGTMEGVTCENSPGMRSINLYANIFDLANGAEPIDRVRATTVNGTMVPAAAADFDNDGDLDLLAIEVVAWRHDESGTVSYEHRPGLVPDGTALLHLIANHQGRMRVAQTFEINLAHWDLQRQAVAVADYDSDGRMDVVISDSQRLFLWHNDGPTRSWACVRPLGVKANADGLGAIVRFAADNLVVRRDVVGPSSHWQDYNRAACAGLGGATSIQFIEICWPGPDPMCERWYDLRVNRLHHLTQFQGSNVTAGI